MTVSTTPSPRPAVSARRSQVSDALLAGGLLIAVESALATNTEVGSGSRWLAAVVGCLAIIPLVWRRRAPLLVWAISSVATFVALLNHRSPGVLALAPLIALYTVATTSPRRVSLAAGGVTLVGVILAVAASRPRGVRWTDVGSAGAKLLFPMAVVAAAWLIGDNLRVRRAYVAELEAKAARTEADRTADVARAAGQERTRIARELHDVVVHHVSVIAVQAGAARMLADQAGDTSDSRQSWLAVETTARTALGELRQILGLLRSDTDPSALAPAPGIDQLDRLVNDVRRAGLPIEARVEGKPRQLPLAIDVSAYRIVQEALTNVLKQAGLAPTTVVIRYRADRLDIEVTNTGPELPSATLHPSGHGLVGMRERTALLGGRFAAHPCPGGGFTVVVSIPIEGQPT